MWLDIHKPMKHQLGARDDVIVSFRFKFYDPDPLQIEDVYVRHLLYLQLREDVAKGKILNVNVVITFYCTSEGRTRRFGNFVKNPTISLTIFTVFSEESPCVEYSVVLFQAKICPDYVTRGRGVDRSKISNIKV